MTEEQEPRLKSYPGRYSWRPDQGDPRDVYYASMNTVPRRIDPTTVIDLSDVIPEIWDQGEFGACVLFSSCFNLVFCEKLQGEKLIKPGFLMPYYNMRAIQHAGSNNDAGGTLRDGIRSLSYWGVCEEKLWPYDHHHFARKPDEKAAADGELHKVKSYSRLRHSLNELIHCLQQGFPFVFGFSVPQSFEDVTGDTGILMMPKSNESFLGGHAVACVGVDYPKRMFKIRNSWSNLWGSGGYFEMPFDFILDNDLSDDFWSVRSVS